MQSPAEIDARIKRENLQTLADFILSGDLYKAMVLAYALRSV